MKLQLKFVAYVTQKLFVVGPPFFNYDEKVEIDFFIDEPFYLRSGIFTDTFDGAAPFADNNPFLGLFFDDNSGPDMFHQPLFIDFVDQYVGLVRDFVADVVEDRFADKLLIDVAEHLRGHVVGIVKVRGFVKVFDDHIE